MTRIEVAPADQITGGDEDVVHQRCCLVKGRSLCGVDLSDAELVEPADYENGCPLCNLISDGDYCPVIGRTCPVG